MDNQIKQERGSEELSAAIVENGYSELDCNPHIYWTKLFECQTLSKKEINKIAETTAKEQLIERNCDNCKRHHTKYCPNSSKCISLPNLPYFETDVIRLLEHDWNVHEKEIDELKAENERIRQTSVTHETFKAIMDEKDKEIAVLNKALELFFEYADHFIQSKQAYKDGYRSSQGYWKDKARKELEEVEK